MSNKKLKIGIGAICKNEEHLIKHFIEFHKRKGFETFIIFDTGSTDNTLEILKEQHINFSEFSFEQPDFSLFRNKLWEKILQSDLDYVIILDIDELIISHDLDKIEQFLKSQNKNAYEINRLDICGGETTKLKRILKVKEGVWLNSVHEHFRFTENDELFSSNIEVLHLNTEKIKSKHKFNLYKSLCENEYNKNKQTDYFYFLLQNIFLSNNKIKILNAWEEFKSFENKETNFFIELILSIFFRFALLSDDKVFEQTVQNEINAIKNINILRFVQIKENIFKIIEKQSTFDEFDFLGIPIKISLTFKTCNDLNLIVLIENLKDRLSNLNCSLRLIQNDFIILEIETDNNLIFNKTFFNDYAKHEKIQLFKYCAQHNIEREIYYEKI